MPWSEFVLLSRWVINLGDFTKLQIWRRSHQLVLAVYHQTRRFPPDERFGLTAQLRRAVTSVAVNVAEGCGRNARLEFAQFLRYSLGSANEVSYLLLLAKDLRLIHFRDWVPLDREVREIRRMVASLERSLRSSRVASQSSN
jgi:four helix bundle protein